MQDYSDIPRIRYSDPTECKPLLTTYKIVNGEAEAAEIRLPEDCTAGAGARLGRLEKVGGEHVFLHVYKGSVQPLQLRVYGITGQGKAVALTPCVEIRAIAHRQRILTRASEFDYLLVRFRVQAADTAAEGTVSLAAYAGAEPAPAGVFVRSKHPKNCRDVSGQEEQERSTEVLPITCDGRAVERILLSTCSADDDLRAWVEATGLEVSDAYYGEKGSVVALGTPPGMDLDTIGGSASKIRSEMQAGEGEVDPDYIINLFSPRQPARCGGRLSDAGDDERQPKGGSEGYLRELLGGRKDAPPFDRNLEPLTVAIIDSGVDHSAAVVGHWDTTRYRQRRETEYVRPWHFGYDFIDQDSQPDDITPHGSYVAATLLAQYRSKRPLELLHLKTFGQHGISSFFGALVSIYEAVAVGSRIINLSWGILQPAPPPTLTCAIATAVREGVYIVTSAGNSKVDIGKEPQWPAAYTTDRRFADHLLTVASYWFGDYTYDTDPSGIDLRRDFSNHGDEEVSVAAFMTAGVPKWRTGEAFFPLGTSISTPIVAGLLAHWLAENPTGTLAEFRDRYFEEADSIRDRVQKGHYLPLEHTVVI